MTVPSIISPALRGVFSFRTLTAPSGATNSILTLVASGTVTDFSLEKKLFLPMVPTLVFESGDHLPME